MSESVFDIDTAWARLVDARTRGDVQERTLAFYSLAQALYETGRHAEADQLDWDAYALAKVSSSSRELSVALFEMMTERGVYLAHSAGVTVAGSDHHCGASGNDPQFVVVTEEERVRLLDCAGTAFDRAEQAIWGREDVPEAWKREADARLGAVRPPRETSASSTPMAFPSMEPAAEQVVVGYLVVKALGPFLEEWAKKLGEQLGESTVRALGRIRLRRHVRSPESELETRLPDTSSPTTLILPEHLSETARLALIDLDPVGEAVRGRTLYWSETEQRWLPADDYTGQHLDGWEIRHTWDVPRRNDHPLHTYDRAPTWEQARSRAVQAGLAAPDGVHLRLIHIRRTSEEDWGRSLPVHLPPNDLPGDLDVPDFLR
ncbi:hypothetical protein AB0M29_19320 [Streptomyces sp. NPDC051976]|uniref:hypothetical protein n=1 Tax=Streptomyces sp. NPDC051976 TaxID=3154947 RepID=UPI003429AA00